MKKKVFYHEDGQIDLVKTFEHENPNYFSKANKRFSAKPSNYSLEPYLGEWSDVQKKHLLNRAMVGFSKKHFDDIKNKSLEESLDFIFTPEEITPPIYNFYHQFSKKDIEERSKDQVSGIYAEWNVQPGETWINQPMNKFATHYAINYSLESWLLEKSIEQKTSIHWKLFYLIYNIIPMHIGIGFGAKSGYQFINTILDHCFGSYKDLIYYVTIDPCMLVYLNGNISQKDNPDENYARELQELYTVGKGPDSKFTEKDVKEISKILTGWKIKYMFPDQNNFEEGPIEVTFDPKNHDQTDKELSEFYNNSIIKGRSGDQGKEELNDLINIIFNTEEASKYLARRIYQFFVSPIIYDECEDLIITPLSNIIKESNYNISVAVKKLLGSQHFFDSTNYGSLIKDPLTFESQIIKEIFLRTIDNYPEVPHNQKQNMVSDPITRKFYMYQMVRGELTKMGYEILSSPSVSGFVPFYQSPAYDMFWINSITLQSKTQIANSYGRGYFHTYLLGAEQSNLDNLNIKLPFVLEDYTNPENLDLLLSEVSFRLLGGEIPEKTLKRIKESILSDKSDEYWAQYFQEFKSNPNNWRPFGQKLSEIFVQVLQLGEAHIY